MIKKHGDLFFGVTLIAMFLFGSALLLSLQDTSGGRPHSIEAEPTATPTECPDGIEVVFVDGLPTAVKRWPSEAPYTAKPTVTPTNSPTPTVTPTQTPTVAPTCTEKPVERISTPKPTQSPTPTQKPVKTENKAYPTGYPRTQCVENGEMHTFKPYARHTAITNKNSVQWKLLQLEHTAENGLRYVVDANGTRRYCIALAPQWAGGTQTDIGRCIDIHMENGAVLHCVLADIKKPEHTEGGNGYYGAKNGEVTEWIVDAKALNDKVAKTGDVSNAGAEFAGAIHKIVVLDMYISGFGR